MAAYATMTEKIAQAGAVMSNLLTVQSIISNASSAEGVIVLSDKSYATQQMAVQNMLAGSRNIIELALGDLETLMQNLLYVPIVKADTNKGLVSFEFTTTSGANFGGSYGNKSWVRAVGVSGENRNPFAVFKVDDVITIANSEHGDNIVDVTVFAILLSEDSDLVGGGVASVEDNVIIITEDSIFANDQGDVSATFTLKTR